MADFSLSKGPVEDKGFFEKNGTLQQMNEVANSIGSLQSGSSISRMGALSRIVAIIADLIKGGG